MSVASVLKELRTTKDLTQEDLATKLKISQSSITAYESGTRTPKLELLEIFARFYGVDMNYITGFKRSPAETSEFSSEDIQFLRLYVQAPDYLKELIKAAVSKSVSEQRKQANREPIAKESPQLEELIF